MTASLAKRAYSLVSLPASADPIAGRLLASRGMRAFADGLVSLSLPIYLASIGFDLFEVGVLTTATLAGSAILTLAVGMLSHHFSQRRMLLSAAMLMTLTGLAFFLVKDFWPLVIVAFVGTLNPSSGDVSVFLPLEHARLAHSVSDRDRTAMFARYSLVGSLFGALGALAAGLPELLQIVMGLSVGQALQPVFLLYAAVGLASFLLYRRVPRERADVQPSPPQPLHKSRTLVLTLAALFSIDAFAGGLIVQSLLAIWLYHRFGLSLAATGAIFFWSGVLSAASYLIAVRLSNRIGLVNTMVFTHLPSSLCLLLIPFVPDLSTTIVLFLIRSALSQMDVPTRTSYVMAIVTPGERAAAASVTSVPRSLAAASSPLLAGWLMSVSSFGWPLVAAAALKILYDILLLFMFRKHRPPEER
ncbi:MFS family permease [Rhizobium mongolense]|uniref:MFS family permease n=3 Tax=Rhizobium mongolense TaxID=57676 RepID=A0ABR6IVB0_9HYPH|nr:MFS transporter [Rhizobium mongolense]MBB4231715.1 MFS family permease [Rhizobium mongolense]TVZ64282.1 putative MFS family arabinose efflux permease [Rhizobium mongolense USDA 1844]